LIAKEQGIRIEEDIYATYDEAADAEIPTRGVANEIIS
jgi:hypothetical protein